MESKQDLVEKCKGCGKEFTITVSEQNFYESKELSLPKRCPECRAARKKANMTQEEQDKAFEDMLMVAFTSDK